MDTLFYTPATPEDALKNIDFEYEARRHRVAFGVKRWKRQTSTYWRELLGRSQGLQIECRFGLGDQGAWGLSVESPGYAPDIYIAIGFDGSELYTQVNIFEGLLTKSGFANQAVLHLAKAAVKLGHSIEGLESEFGPLLSQHEQMELRLSLPREFWHPKWLAEEAR